MKSLTLRRSIVKYAVICLGLFGFVWVCLGLFGSENYRKMIDFFINALLDVSAVYRVAVLIERAGR